MSLDTLYQKLILEHNRNPHNFGPLPSATHIGRAQDALCGDDLEMALEVVDDHIVAAHFSGEACAVTQASASMLTDWLVGRPIDSIAPAFSAFSAMLSEPNAPPVAELGALNELKPVGAFPARRGNACLPWLATLRALGRDV